MKEQKIAWTKGWDAMERGELLADNPYDPDKSEISKDLYQQWIRGYESASEQDT